MMARRSEKLAMMKVPVRVPSMTGEAWKPGIRCDWRRERPIEVMSCENEQKVIASLLDGREEFDGEGGALGHVAECVSCHARYGSLSSLRNALRAMHAPAMPDGLAERLRVLASHERQRLLLRVNLAARLAARFD